MLFQQKVNAILEANQLVGANEPLGLWRYGKFESSEELGLQNDLKDEIDKYCGIFKTLGDRRLQTNLSQGLCRLIKDVVKEGRAEIANQSAIEELLTLFKSKGRFDETKGELQPSWKLKKFRQQEIGQRHSDYIASSRIYTEEENAMLNDYFADNLASLEPLQKFACALKSL